MLHLLSRPGPLNIHVCCLLSQNRIATLLIYCVYLFISFISGREHYLLNDYSKNCSTLISLASFLLLGLKVFGFFKVRNSASVMDNIFLHNSKHSSNLYD